MYFLVTLAMASTPPCADEKLLCLARSIGVSSAQLDQSAAELIADMKKRNENPQAFLDAQNAFRDFRAAECAGLSKSDTRSFPSTEEGMECWIRLNDQRRSAIEEYWPKRAD